MSNNTNEISIVEFDNFDNVFDDNNRYYVYEDFIGEQFIWIERHELKI